MAVRTPADSFILSCCVWSVVHGGTVAFAGLGRTWKEQLKQVNIFGTHSLLIARWLVLKMPPSTCCSEPTLIWTKQAAL